MQAQVSPVQLSARSPAETTVKRGALTFFRALRVAIEHSKQVPGIIEKAAVDVRQAWEESSRPNA